MSASVRRQFRQISAEDLHRWSHWERVPKLVMDGSCGNTMRRGTPRVRTFVGTLVAGIMGLTLTGLLLVRKAI
ncbi:Uncharacterised protein [Mycobacteroides abscessus subsp. abscessus]|nr:Uncharacterised protein [Mycobacteroides abscessus subsp. abscessus]